MTVLHSPEDDLRSLLRYRDGSRLLTLLPHTVPDRLATTFPLTLRAWAAALARLGQPDNRQPGTHVEVTFLHGRVPVTTRAEMWFHPGRNVPISLLSDGNLFTLQPSRLLHCRTLPSSGYVDEPTPWQLLADYRTACQPDPPPGVRADDHVVVAHDDRPRLRVRTGRLDHHIRYWLTVGPCGPGATVLPHGFLAIAPQPTDPTFAHVLAEHLAGRIGEAITATLIGDAIPGICGVLHGLKPPTGTAPAALLVGVADATGFSQCVIPIGRLASLDAYPTDRPHGRHGRITPIALPTPDAHRRQVLDKTRRPGDTLDLLHIPAPGCVASIRLTVVTATDRHILVGHPPGNDETVVIPLEQILAADAAHTTVPRTVAARMAWWTALEQFLTDHAGRPGRLTIHTDGDLEDHHGTTFLGMHCGRAHFATAHGQLTKLLDDIVAFDTT